MKNLGLNKKPREGIPTGVLIIPQGVLFGREEYGCEVGLRTKIMGEYSQTKW